jgi:hypothetical protein
MSKGRHSAIPQLGRNPANSKLRPGLKQTASKWLQHYKRIRPSQESGSHTTTKVPKFKFGEEEPRSVGGVVQIEKEDKKCPYADPYIQGHPNSIERGAGSNNLILGKLAT